MVVVWRTQGPINPVVRFGQSPTALTQEVRGAAITLRVSADVNAAAGVPRLYKEPAEEVKNREADHDPSTPPNTYQYEAHISGLQPGSKYHYAIQDGDRSLAGGDADHYFITHQPIGSETDMRIWVVGDSGNGTKEQHKVHDAMRAYVAKSNRPINHYIHVGDMAYSDGTDREFHEFFFAPYRETLRNTVVWPSMGNHEGHTSRGIAQFGPYFDAYVVPMAAEAGGVPSGTENYYSFDISGVHFICLNSHDLDRGLNGAMAQWLRADLDQAKAKWLVAFWHHPPYTKGSHNSDTEKQLIEMRENFMPMLEAAGVDLVLTGHSHIYERSMLMDGAYATPTTAAGVILDDGNGNPAGDGAYRKSAGLHPHEGSVSVVAGNGGAGLGREGTMPVMREIILEHGSVILDIQGDTMNGIMLNKDGVTRDIFSIVKQGKVTPTRVVNPWQPVHDISLLTEIRVDFAADVPGARPEGWSVTGSDGPGVIVAVEPGGKRKFLHAEARSEPVVALFTPFKVSDVEIETEIRMSPTSTTAGLVFSHVDARNYSRILLDKTAGTLRMSRVVDGAETVVAEQKATIVADQWLELEVEIVRGKLTFSFNDGEVEFSTKFDGPYPQSPVGLFVGPNSAADFRWFVIKDEKKR